MNSSTADQPMKPSLQPRAPVFAGMAAVNKLWLLLLVVIPLYLTWTFDHSLWNPDETRDGGIAAEMFRTGNFVVPKLNGEAFLEKPPLYYWTSAIVYTLTGRVTAGTTRLPAALFGILGVLFTFLIGKRLFNERVGFFGAAMLATSVQYFRMSHFAMMDIALAALVTGALFFHLKGSKVGFLVFAILAFYAKGFLGILLAGLVVTPHLLLERRPKDLAVTIGLGILLFSVAVLPWFWCLWKEGGARFLEIFIIDNHWKRFFSRSADHTEHFWFFYFLSFPVDFLPWTPFFIGLIRNLIKEPQKYLESKSLRFLLVWFFGLLAFFCFSSSKRSIYLLPLFPAAALLSAAWLDAAIRGKQNEARIERFFFAGVGLLAVLIGTASFVFASRLDREKSFRPVTDAAKAIAGNGVIVGYNMSEMERGVFGFYLNGPIRNPSDPVQLARTIEEIRPNSFCLIVNRNKINEIDSVLESRARLVFEHRPDKKTRAYRIYTNSRGAKE